jgi:hypothetical protein
LDEAAKIKPQLFAIYLFTFNFSFNNHVVPKSITIPEKPTAQNFKNFRIKDISIIFQWAQANNFHRCKSTKIF